jgi:fructosamine-3-kinase
MGALSLLKREGNVMKNENMLQQLEQCNVLPAHYKKITPLKGGSTSNVTLVELENGDKWVIKSNEPSVIKLESLFLQFYKSNKLLPRIHFVADDFTYLAYTYIEGCIKRAANKKDILPQLCHQLINTYQKRRNNNEWGWADDPVSSWSQFLESRVEDTCPLLHELPNEEHNLVIALINHENRSKSLHSPYYLHGDCGVHNIIIKNETIQAVIDPTPVYGPRHYDLLYAFCSSPDHLTWSTIQTAMNYLKGQPMDRKVLVEEVLLILYFRMGTCKRHHSEDFPQYLVAWKYWKQLFEKES